MPRTQKPARLWYRKTRKIWFILDGGKQIPTGTADLEQAEKALADYTLGRVRSRSGPATPENISCGDVLMRYADEYAPTVADPARIGYAIEALLGFWDELPVSSISGQTCRRYVAYRNRAAGTTRRELGVLRAAVNYSHREGWITRNVGMVLPDKPEPRDRWLTRDEAARLIRAARSDPRSRHVAWFVLIALYTGTRKQAILGLQLRPNLMGGWIDLDTGMLHRKGVSERSTKKKRGTVPMPRRLLGHMRRLEANGHVWAVEYKGGGCLDVKRAFAKSCRLAGLDDVTPHTLKHTAITWAMQRGVSIGDAAAYFSTSVQTIEAVYWHHSPDYMRAAVDAMDRRS